MATRNFPALHQEFYKEFEKWRKEKLEKGLPQGGVYKLIANKKIGRLLSDDDLGVLYIGKGVILPYHNRIGKFVNSLNDTERIHDGGTRFNILEEIQEKYPLKNAVVEITLTEYPEKLERRLLDKYYIEFGELPPFNRRKETVFEK